MSKDIKENLLSLHEKKGHFNREIETILKIVKWTIHNWKIPHMKITELLNRKFEMTEERVSKREDISIEIMQP